MERSISSAGDCPEKAETRKMSELTTAEQKMSSREIAEMYGKPHNDTLKKIRSLENAYVQAYGAEGNFSHGSYIDENNQKRPEIRLTKSQALFVASRFDAVLHAKIQKRWEDLETGKSTPLFQQAPIKTAHGLLEVDKAFRAALRMAKAIGLDSNAAIISANQLARKVTGSDALQLLEVRGIERPVEDHPLTPTEIGRFIGNLSGQTINKQLTLAGLQVKNGDIYTPTTKGAEFAVLLDTGKRHGDGTPVHQLKWKRRVVDQLKRSILDQVEPEAVTEN